MDNDDFAPVAERFVSACTAASNTVSSAKGVSRKNANLLGGVRGRWTQTTTGANRRDES